MFKRLVLLDMDASPEMARHLSWPLLQLLLPKSSVPARAANEEGMDARLSLPVCCHNVLKGLFIVLSESQVLNQPHEFPCGWLRMPRSTPNVNGMPKTGVSMCKGYQPDGVPIPMHVITIMN